MASAAPTAPRKPPVAYRSGLGDNAFPPVDSDDSPGIGPGPVDGQNAAPNNAPTNPNNNAPPATTANDVLDDDNTADAAYPYNNRRKQPESAEGDLAFLKRMTNSPPDGHGWDGVEDNIIKELRDYADLESYENVDGVGFNLTAHGGGKIQWMCETNADGQKVEQIRTARAFGGKFSFNQNDADAMVALARVRGWKSINVHGSTKQKDLLWLAAMMQGMPVKGYTPEAGSKADLAWKKYQAEQAANNNALDTAGPSIMDGASQFVPNAQHAPVAPHGATPSGPVPLPMPTMPPKAGEATPPAPPAPPAATAQPTTVPDTATDQTAAPGSIFVPEHTAGAAKGTEAPTQTSPATDAPEEPYVAKHKADRRSKLAAQKKTQPKQG